MTYRMLNTININETLEGLMLTLVFVQILKYGFCHASGCKFKSSQRFTVLPLQIDQPIQPMSVDVNYKTNTKTIYDISLSSISRKQRAKSKQTHCIEMFIDFYMYFQLTLQYIYRNML